ncbi:MAG: hypothetical protein GYB31_07600 [Bacteroidetes bacterium]|nr:hypothetical protein [Bacteroidota bacterium]
MRLFSITILLISLFATSLNAQEIPWLKGSWHGIGYQAPTDSNWEIVLKYDEDIGNLNVSYPSLECGGSWKLVESREGYAEFVEQITEGTENCDNSVKVVVTQIDDEFISVAYFLPEYFDGVVAYSVMRKKEGEKPKLNKYNKGKVKKT